MFKSIKTIKSKLLISYTIVPVIAAITVFICANCLRTSNTRYSEAMTNYGFSQGDIGKAMLAISNANGHAHDIVSYEDQGDLDETKKQREAELEEYEKYINEVEKSLVNSATKSQYEKAIEATDKYEKKAQELIKKCGTLDTSVELDYLEIENELVKTLNPLYEEAYAEWEKLLDIKVTNGDELRADISKRINNTYIVVIILSVFALITAGIIAILGSNAIANPIVACVDRIKRLAKGDIHSPVEVSKDKDEVGQLTVALNDLVSNLGNIIKDEHYLLGKMAEGDFEVFSNCEESYVGDFKEILESIRGIRSNLSSMLIEIDVASEHVSVGSEQVASGAQELAQGATQQASAIEQLNATIASIANQIKENAQNAMNASDIAKESSREVEESNNKMNEMIAAMTEISDTSNKIAKIIKTIDDIAFQTNILALNAAVEAARAGEAGKGFAVVADEVRSLAGKSAEAAQNTTQLIESSINAVSNGTRIADDTAEALKGVVDATNKSTTLVNQIATASEEQAKSVEEATKGLDQISTVVQTNSATSEESAAASEELSAQAAKMRELISKFKVKRDNKVNTKTTSLEDNKKNKKEFKEYKSSISLENFSGSIDLGEEDYSSYNSKY